jgi:hypothetical protein
MSFIFRSYPAHPWFTEWTFESRGCGTTFREKNAGYFFQALETVGRIAPNLESPEWSLQIPIPQNSRINILFNGFCGYLEQKKRTYSAEVMVPEAGVLWGRFSNIPTPVLLTDEPLVETDGFQWLESDTSPALLAVRDDHFCLIAKARIFADAVALAEDYLERDLEAVLTEELQRRAGASQFFEQMSHHDALAVISTECMMRSLRLAEGTIPGLWSQSPTADKPQFNINELYPLALTWRHIDIAVAEDLVRSALKLQGSSGAIPVAYSPHETFSVLEAPKPLIAKTTEKVWQVRNDPQFLADILQPLRRHLQWLLHHFDPKRRGLHCWQNRDEPLAPETYQSGLATADLAALLLTEIEALNRLRLAAPDTASQPPWFEKERDTLEHNLLTQFWNEEETRFSNALVRGRIEQVTGFPSFVPLLWGKLPARQQNMVLERIKESGMLPGGVSILSWRKSALDNHSFPLLQQLLVLETLKAADPHGTLVRDFARITLQGFVEWHTLSLKEYGTLPIDPVTAAYIMELQETHSYRYHAKGRISGFLFKLVRQTRIDGFDFAVILLTILSILSVHFVYNQHHSPPPFITLEAQLNDAYSSQDGEGTIDAGLMLIKHYPERAALARLMTANIFLLRQQYEEAAVLLFDLRQEYPDSPGAMIALGLSFQLQGNFAEADVHYAEFTYLFDEIFPTLVTEIQQFRYLMQEGFRSPPKWQEIYGYQIMHEL